MRLGVCLALGAGLAVSSAFAAEFNGEGSDLKDFELKGVKLGDSLAKVSAAHPDAKITIQRHAVDKKLVIGRRVDLTEEIDGVVQTLDLRLTQDRQVESIELTEPSPEELISHPALFVDRWIERFGLPNKDYEVVGEDGRTVLIWTDLPLRRQLMSITLTYEPGGACAEAAPEGVDCAKYPTVYKKFVSSYLLKDRRLGRANQVTISKILKRRKKLLDIEKKKK